MFHQLSKQPHREATSRSAKRTRLSDRLGRCLANWADWIRRFAVPVVIASLLVTLAAGAYTARNLGVHTSRDSMFAEDLAFLKDARRFNQAFPVLVDPLVVVVDAPTPEQSERVARALADRMGRDQSHFSSVFFPEGDEFFRRNGLLFLDQSELEALSDQLAGALPILATLASDPSLRGLFGVLGRGTDAVADGEADPQALAPALAAVADLVEKTNYGSTAQMSWQELMDGGLGGESANRKIVIAQPTYDYSSLQPAARSLAAVRAIIGELDLQADGVLIRLTGDAAIAEEELGSVEAGIGLASMISLALVTIVTFVGLRSPRIVLAIMLALLMSFSWTAAFAAGAVGHLNLISVAFGVLFIGLAVDFSIQLAMRYREELAADGGHAAALREAARGSGVAVVLAAIAASIGFFSFVPTDFTGLAELGLIAGVGMLIGLFSTITLVPALLTLFKPRPEPKRATKSHGARLGLWLVAHPRRVVVAAAAVGIGASATLPLSRFDVDPINLKDPNTESVRTFRELAHASDTSPYSINILTADIDAAQRLAEQLDRLPEVAKTLTAATFVPDQQDAKLALIDQMALFLLPALEATTFVTPPNAEQQREAIRAFRLSLQGLLASRQAGELESSAGLLVQGLARYSHGESADDGALARLDRALMLNLPLAIERLREALNPKPITLAALPAALRARYISADGLTRVEVYPREAATDIDNLRRFVTAVREIAPNATDTSVMLLEAGRTMVTALEQAGAYALGLISLLLLLVLRSVVDSVLVLLPLLLAALLTTASGVLFGIPFNFANIIAVPLLFSLGVAFGIYLVMRARESRSIEALMRTSTPRAVVFSALTTMVSFGSLMISSHRGTASMGELLSLSLTFALLCTVIVLPALLEWRAQNWSFGLARRL